MATTSALLTVDEFLKLPQTEGIRRELSDGEVIETDMGNAGPRHEWVKANFNRIFVLHIAQHGSGTVFIETLFKLGSAKARIPDVSVLLNPRLPTGDSPFQNAPDIVIEIVSSEPASELEQKVEQFLESGAKIVLVAYPELRAIRVFAANGDSSLLRQDQFLELPDLLSGFRVSVAKFFEGI